MIIKSVLDTDLYKFTMQNAVIHSFPRLNVEYEFFNRNEVEFPEGFDIELKKELNLMKDLFLTKEEKEFLTKTCGRFLPPTYIDFLESYRFDPSEIIVDMDGSKLKIKIKGLWYRTILWEVPLLALISELYYKLTLVDNYPSDDKLISLFEDKNIIKANRLKFNDCTFSEFGSRRRFSFQNQANVINILKQYSGKNFVGTSNCYLAMLNNCKPSGTMAHEWIMAIAGILGYRRANYEAMSKWIDSYSGDLGIALTDTYGTDIFLNTFDLKEAKLFDGVRHDSGDPFKYVDKIVEHYKKLGINPLDKTIVFSDGLDIDLCLELRNYCSNKIKPAFGIGTHFTNDLKSIGIKPLNIVIKLTKVKVDNEWVGCVKLSDNFGKHTGTLEDIDQCKKTLKIKTVDYNRLPSGNEDDKVIKENIVE